MCEHVSINVCECVYVRVRIWECVSVFWVRVLVQGASVGEQREPGGVVRGGTDPAGPWGPQ